MGIKHIDGNTTVDYDGVTITVPSELFIEPVEFHQLHGDGEAHYHRPYDHLSETYEEFVQRILISLHIRAQEDDYVHAQDGYYITYFVTDGCEPNFNDCGVATTDPDLALIQQRIEWLHKAEDEGLLAVRIVKGELQATSSVTVALAQIRQHRRHVRVFPGRLGHEHMLHQHYLIRKDCEPWLLAHLQAHVVDPEYRNSLITAYSSIGRVVQHESESYDWRGRLSIQGMVQGCIRNKMLRHAIRGHRYRKLTESGLNHLYVNFCVLLGQYEVEGIAGRDPMLKGKLLYEQWQRHVGQYEAQLSVWNPSQSLMDELKKDSDKEALYLYARLLIKQEYAEAYKAQQVIDAIHGGYTADFIELDQKGSVAQMYALLFGNYDLALLSSAIFDSTLPYGHNIHIQIQDDGQLAKSEGARKTAETALCYGQRGNLLLAQQLQEGGALEVIGEFQSLMWKYVPQHVHPSMDIRLNCLNTVLRVKEAHLSKKKFFALKDGSQASVKAEFHGRTTFLDIPCVFGKASRSEMTRGLIPSICHFLDGWLDNAVLFFAQQMGIEIFSVFDGWFVHPNDAEIIIEIHRQCMAYLASLPILEEYMMACGIPQPEIDKFMKKWRSSSLDFTGSLSLR